MQTSEIHRIRVLLAKEGDYWVGQCLEFDIGAQARDLGELTRRLTVAIAAEREEGNRRHGKPFGGIAGAPLHFHELWERRAGRFEPSQPATVPNGDGINLEFGITA
jgi:hypothetical protein